METKSLYLIPQFLSHAYDYQCRCAQCTAQEIAWRKLSITPKKKEKKS